MVEVKVKTVFVNVNVVFLDSGTTPFYCVLGRERGFVGHPQTKGIQRILSYISC